MNWSIVSTCSSIRSIKRDFFDKSVFHVDEIDTFLRYVDVLPVFRQVRSICRSNRHGRDAVGEIRIFTLLKILDAARRRIAIESASGFLLIIRTHRRGCKK